jgi:hypothetical protein
VRAIACLFTPVAPLGDVRTLATELLSDGQNFQPYLLPCRAHNGKSGKPGKWRSSPVCFPIEKSRVPDPHHFANHLSSWWRKKEKESARYTRIAIT